MNGKMPARQICPAGASDRQAEMQCRRGIMEFNQPVVMKSNGYLLLCQVGSILSLWKQKTTQILRNNIVL